MISTADGQTELVKWRLVRWDVHWRIVGVKVLGLWLAIEQRAQIEALFKQFHQDIAAVIAHLNERRR